MKTEDGPLQFVRIEDCVALKRNPQYLTPHQMEALKKSIERDGFLAPVLLRPHGARFEVISGNHRVMAAKELGHETIPAIVREMTDSAAARAALNLNTVHGNPNAELMAPFLAELDDDTLSTVHLDEGLLREISQFDAELKSRLDTLSIPDAMDHDSPSSALPNCVCECGNRHVKKG